MIALLGCWCRGQKVACSARATPCRSKYFLAVSRSDRGRDSRPAGEGSQELGRNVRGALSPLLLPSVRGRAFAGTVRNLVCRAIVKPQEAGYGDQEGHTGRAAFGT